MLNALALALLVPVGRLAFGDVASGVAAAAAAALHGALAFHGLKILPVPLALATQGAALLAVLWARERNSVGTAALAGALAGLAALARAEMLLFVPLGALAIAVKGRWSRGAVVLGAAVLVLLPATLHNAREGGFVPVASSAGDNLFVGNQRGATGAVGALDPRAGDLFSMRVLSRRLAEEAAGRPLNPAEVSAHWMHRALDEIAADPAGWIVLLGRKLLRVVHPGDPNDLYSLPLERGLYLPLLQPLRLTAWPLLALAVAGLCLAWRRAWPVAALAACQLAVLLVFFVSTRLRLPFFYALTPFAGYALTRVKTGTGLALLALVVAGAFLEQPAARDRLRLASVLSTNGRLEEGLTVLAPCTGEEPDALCLDQRGWLLERQGRLDLAAEAYRAALERGLPPGRSASTHSRFAFVLERQGRLEAAAREHDAAVQDPAGAVGAHLERARFRARRGDLAGAREDLAEARRLEPAWDEPARVAAELGIALP